MRIFVLSCVLLMSSVVFSSSLQSQFDTIENGILSLLDLDRPYTTVSEDVFNSLGWTLPDGGRHVKALADRAPGSAFDPRRLESLPSKELGYRARWHTLRYKHYGLDWDITGLQLIPNSLTPGLPTLAIIHGGSANWYEFYVDPLNRPGLAQYLAQKLPVMLITIPGNYKDGGWEEPYSKRVAEYVLGLKLTAEEARIRNAVFTFALVTEGVRRILEQSTKGPLLILGHSTGGEIQFLLKNSSLKTRLDGRSLGWGTGGPAILRKQFDEHFGIRQDRVTSFGRYPRVSELRPRSPEGYVSSNYVGPLNPLPGSSALEVAQAWFEREGRRRPQFKQVLQDMEHQGMLEHRRRLENEIRETLYRKKYRISADDVIRDLFSTMSSPLEGYRRMVWVVGKLDDGHWDSLPENALEFGLARRFRKENPACPIRVLLVDTSITHYGHIERPKELAAVLVSAVRWLGTN